MDIAFVPFFLIIISVMIPINLKYGADKGRIVLIVICGLVVGTAFLGKKIFVDLLKDTDRIELEYFLAKLSSLPKYAVLIACFVIAFVIFFIAMKISSGIMSKKEF